MAEYLYNDAHAVDIDTVWKDKKTFQYAIIVYNGVGMNFLYLLSVPVKYRVTNPGSLSPRYYLVPTADGKMLCYEAYDGKWAETLDIDDISWNPCEVYEKDIVANEAFSINRKPKWSSFELYNEDGTLLPINTDPVLVPVPVGGGADPIALTMRLVGQIVRGLRGK